MICSIKKIYFVLTVGAAKDALNKSDQQTGREDLEHAKGIEI